MFESFVVPKKLSFEIGQKLTDWRNNYPTKKVYSESFGKDKVIVKISYRILPLCGFAWDRKENHAKAQRR